MYALHRCVSNRSYHGTLRSRFKQVHLLRNYRTACAELPQEIESKLSGWLYGCDICQDVCPWNRLKTTAEARFAPREGNVNAELAEIIELTETYACVFAAAR